MAARSLSLSSPTTPSTKASQTHSERTKATCLRPPNLQSLWLSSSKLSFHSSILRPLIPSHPTISASVLFSLPTANPERVSSTEKVSKWSEKAIKAFAMGELEARKLKYPATGTEALLMGILIEGTNLASKFLRANGITLLKVREETVKLLGKADLYFFSPEHPPLTEATQSALDWAVDEKLKSSERGEITTVHLLLAVWAEDAAPGHKILSLLGFNNDKAQELKALFSEKGFVED